VCCASKPFVPQLHEIHDPIWCKTSFSLQELRVVITLTGEEPLYMTVDQETSITREGSAWGTAVLKALTSISSRDSAEIRQAYHVTTPPVEDCSRSGHYQFQKASTSDMTRKSSTTTTTVVELGEMANTQSTMGACSPPPKETNKPGWRFYAAFGCLCIINLVCALDATSLSVALPVCLEKSKYTSCMNAAC